MVSISEISDGELPRSLSGLGQTKSGGVFDTLNPVSKLSKGVKAVAQVKSLQLLLNKFGYGLTVDGIFGAGTEAAVKKVQEKFSMVPNGVYDMALDERINGVTASGVIDATSKDREQISVAQTAPPKPSTTTLAPGGVTIDVVAQQLPGGLQPTAPSLFARYKAWLSNASQNPNFKLYAAGAVVAVVGAIIVVPMLFGGSSKSTSPVQLLGLGKTKSKKRKSKKKSEPVYVMFGDTEHRPLNTQSFPSMAKARAAVARSKAEGWPARIKK